MKRKIRVINTNVLNIYRVHLICVGKAPNIHPAYGEIDPDGMGWCLYGARSQKDFTAVQKVLCKASASELKKALKRADQENCRVEHNLPVMSKKAREEKIRDFIKTTCRTRYPDFVSTARSVASRQGLISTEDLGLLWAGFKSGLLCHPKT